MKALVLVAALAVIQEAPEPAQQEPHAWLRQLVGEWSVTPEGTTVPGADPVRFEGTWIDSVQTHPRTALVENDAGTWTVFGRADFRRKR